MNYFAAVFAIIYALVGWDMLWWRRRVWPAIGMLALSAAFFTAMAFRWV